MKSDSDPRLRIGIVGGGIAGVGLALGLCRHPHLEVQLFESAAAFGEIGAGVSFGANAVRAITGLGMGEAYAALADRTSPRGRTSGSNGDAAATPATSARASRRAWGSPRCIAPISSMRWLPGCPRAGPLRQTGLCGRAG